MYRGVCSIFVCEQTVGKGIAKGKGWCMAGEWQVKQISRAIAAFWLQSSNLNLPGLGRCHRSGEMLTGDMMPSMMFLLTVEMFPCVVSDLHLMAVNANFVFC